MFAWLVDGKPSADPARTSATSPRPSTGLSSIALVVGTFVAFAGLEVNAVHIKHLKGRPRSYFKAVLSAAAAGLRDVHARLDRDLGGRAGRTLELTSGASQAFTVYADGFGIPGLSNVLSGLLVLGAVAASIAWIAGPSRSMWLVGRAGYLPQRFQKVNKNDVQMPILLFQGVIVTILSLVFVVAPNTSAAFAMLQDISIILYMGMYVCMFASAIRLRRSQPDVERPIRINGLAGDRLHRHPRRPVRHRPGADPAGRLQRRARRVVRPIIIVASWSSPSPPSSCTASGDRSGPASTRPRSSPSSRSRDQVHAVTERTRAS